MIEETIESIIKKVKGYEIEKEVDIDDFYDSLWKDLGIKKKLAYKIVRSVYWYLLDNKFIKVYQNGGMKIKRVKEFNESEIKERVLEEYKVYLIASFEKYKNSI